MAIIVKTIPSNYKFANAMPSSKGQDDISLAGGQGVIFEIKNLNILGTTFTVTSIRAALRDPGLWRNLLGDWYQMSEKICSIILPLQTVYYQFTCFGCEPMSWKFRTTTNSDVCMVGLKIWSTWVKGMRPNR